MSEETVDRPLDRALASIDDWVGSDRQPDETGALGMPPLSAHIIIDGASVAWAYGERKKFSSEGLKKVMDWFLAKGYTNVKAFVSLTYSQEPPPGSQRTRVADDTELLKTLNNLGRLEFTPAGAADESFIVEYGWLQRGFVVSNNDLKSFKRTCSAEQQEWLRAHHIYFNFLHGEFLPLCDLDDRAWDASPSPAPEDDLPPQTFEDVNAAFASSHPNAASSNPSELRRDAHSSEPRARDMPSPPVPAEPFQVAPGPGEYYPADVVPGAVDSAPRIVTPLTLLALLRARGLNRVDSGTLEALLKVMQSSTAPAVLLGHLGLVTRVGGPGGAGAIQVDGELEAGPGLVRVGVVMVGDSVEVDAVRDSETGAWCIWRLVRTGCVVARERGLWSGVETLQKLLGFADVPAMLHAWHLHPDIDVSHARTALLGAVFTTSHLSRNAPHYCAGISAPANLQPLFDPSPHTHQLATAHALPATVADYFTARQCALLYPALPCLCATAPDSSLLFFPLEYCRVEYFPPPLPSSLPSLPSLPFFGPSDARSEEAAPRGGGGGGGRKKEGFEEGVEAAVDRFVGKVASLLDSYPSVTSDIPPDQVEQQARLVDAEVRRQLQIGAINGSSAAGNGTLAPRYGADADENGSEAMEEEEEEEEEARDPGASGWDNMEGSVVRAKLMAAQWEAKRAKSNLQRLHSALASTKTQLTEAEEALRRRNAVIGALKELLKEASKKLPDLKAKMRAQLKKHLEQEHAAPSSQTS